MNTIYILSFRDGSEMYEPEVYKTEEDAFKAGEEWLSLYIIDAYVKENGKRPDSRKQAFSWVEENGYGNDKFLYCGYGHSVEYMVTKVDIE